MYVLDKEAALSRLRIIPRDVIFAHFEYLEHLIPLLHGHPNLIHDPGARKGPLGVLLVRALALEIVLLCARPAQTE